MSVLFDRGPMGPDTRFDAPRGIVRADTLGDIVPALERMEALRRDGYWLAGFASYEAGYALSPKLDGICPTPEVPFLQFGIFDAPSAGPPPTPGPATLSAPVPRWTAETYAAAFARVQDYISAGDIYQANLTFSLDAEASGRPEALYAALRARQSVGEGALVDLGGPAILCRSPELFFDVDAGGRILTRPMKGTAPRGATPEEDATLVTGLRGSEKNQAENLMIVDLLRNDIGRISRIGSVHVPRLFHVESYATVHQMVSDVTGQLRPGVTLPEIFAALFPCGSITGAPKIRAMQIIAELEGRARGAYCGAVGWIAPDGRMRFGVAIRTLVLTEGHARLDVGGGVVHDSTAIGEYEEALWKARFATI